MCHLVTVTIYASSINTFVLSQRKFAGSLLPLAPTVEDRRARSIGKYKLSMNVISNDCTSLCGPDKNWPLIPAVALLPPSDSRIGCTTHSTVAADRRLLKMTNE